jgi:hypothetical protein
MIIKFRVPDERPRELLHLLVEGLVEGKGVPENGLISLCDLSPARSDVW